MQNQLVVPGLGNLPLGWEQLSQPLLFTEPRLGRMSPVLPPYSFSPAQAR